MKPTISISDIEMVTLPDTDPDLSYIGSYGPTWKANAIDRTEGWGYSPRGYRYFYPANPEYAEQNYERMESYNAGNWRMVGIRARVRIPVDMGGYTHYQEFESPGLWGVEDDGSKESTEYHGEIFEAEKAQLVAMLKAIEGFNLQD